jgi:hypothetical protein
VRHGLGEVLDLAKAGFELAFSYSKSPAGLGFMGKQIESVLFQIE